LALRCAEQRAGGMVVSRSTVQCQPDLESGSSAEFLQGFSRELKAFRRGLSEVSNFVLSTTNVNILTIPCMMSGAVMSLHPTIAMTSQTYDFIVLTSLSVKLVVCVPC
jgi:hypothetical protein